MKKGLAILAMAAAMVALPFIFKPKSDGGDWGPDDPVLVVITPHNEAIRDEFAAGFSSWHARKFGSPVRIDWRVIGGTTEIMRYLVSEYVGSMQGWRERHDLPFPSDAASAMLSGKMPEDDGSDAARLRREVWLDFRTNDSPSVASSRIDIFFGGGTYDHGKAAEQGLTVAPWPDGDLPPGLVADDEGNVLIPKALSGDVWRTDHFYGTVLSTFGICSNPDRLKDIGADAPPATWYDLAKPAFFGQVGVTDPTKSGSVAKAFEMIVQQVMADTVRAAGYTEADIDANEAAIAANPAIAAEGGALADYERTVEAAWVDGVNLVRLIGANARYFTDSAGKVPIDVGMGAIATGIAIDFFGRFQAEYTRTPDGVAHLEYVTPKGGSCVSADPMSLMRGAPNRELALRFIEFVLSPEGQALWNARPGTEGGTRRYAIRRLPIRRDFYPSDIGGFKEVYSRYAPIMSDDLGNPAVNPYELAKDITYRQRWSGRHFGIQRDLVRAICIDSGDELRAAWKAVIENGGPEANPEAMALILALPTRPVPVSWASATREYRGIPRLEYMRQWTAEMRGNYRAALRLATQRGGNWQAARACQQVGAEKRGTGNGEQGTEQLRGTEPANQDRATPEK